MLPSLEIKQALWPQNYDTAEILQLKMKREESRQCKRHYIIPGTWYDMPKAQDASNPKYTERDHHVLYGECIIHIRHIS